MDDLYWLGFSAFSGIGPARFAKLLEKFGNAKNAWFASNEEFADVLGQSLQKKFIDFRENFSLENYAQQLIDKKISYILSNNPTYPTLLKHIPHYPFVLYVKGNVDLVSQSAKTIAVVGTRKPTHYGEQVTQSLTKSLVDQGFVIVSGLAIGVDRIAHIITMRHNGKTIAVLGCGVDCCTPSINEPIYDKIIGNFGAIVSESAFGAASAKGVFPARNRIIAGLTQAVLVTEGAADSGALITAQRAFELGRPVFTVPGPITSELSGGTNSLLQQGAVAVTRPEDILQTLGMHSQQMQIVKKVYQISDDPKEQRILDLLSTESLTLDDLVRASEKDSAQIGSVLSMMEIKGLVKNEGGKFSIV